MTTIVWDVVGERVYEAGLDKGVLYFPEGGGVPWNGLISVQEKVNTKTEPVYFDGVKINDLVTVGDFSATLKAYTYPEEFLRFEGVLEDQTGLFLTNQQPSPFHLSYRTKVGNDIDGIDNGYKIHMIYNIIAVPSSVQRATLSLEVDPIDFQWELTAIPEEVAHYKPTPHIIIDSRDISALLLADIEELLYGNVSDEPRLPSAQELVTFVRSWS